MQALSSGVTLVYINSFHLIVVLLLSFCIFDTLLVLANVSIRLMLLVGCLGLCVVRIPERVDSVFVNYYRKKEIDS